jgi:hypothetical protein
MTAPPSAKREKKHPPKKSGKKTGNPVMGEGNLLLAAHDHNQMPRNLFAKKFATRSQDFQDSTITPK